MAQVQTENIWDDIGDAFSDLGDGIADAVEDVGDWVGHAAGDIAGAVGDAVAALGTANFWESVGDAVVLSAEHAFEDAAAIGIPI